MELEYDDEDDISEQSYSDIVSYYGMDYDGEMPIPQKNINIDKSRL